MKKILALLLVLFSMQTMFAQVLDPVKWSGTVEKISDTEYNLIYTAEIENHWHLYSQNLPEGGALPTEFIYDENVVSKDFELVGKASESKSTTKFDKVFEMEMTYFDYEATFTQKIKILNPELTSVEAEISYQACDDAKCIFESRTVDFQIKKSTNNSKILDPVKWESSIYSLGDNEYEVVYTAALDKKWHIYSQDNKDPMGPIPTAFTFKNDNKDYKLIGGVLESKSIEKFEKAFGMDVKYFSDKAVFSQKIKVLNTDIKTIEAEAYYQACDDEKCLAPAFFDFKSNLKDATKKSTVDTETIPLENSDNEESRGLWGIFFIAFLSGFAALLTPCVFPMIPMTVSFFTKQSKSKAAGIKNAIIYGLCIIVIYLLLGTAVTGVFGADALNALATNVWFNIIFFILLVVFAFSFLGAFEIMLPNSWANKVDSQANRGGMVGIFFMALALAIVSFSCTGPIVGTLLVEAASKGGLAPIIGMLGFSSAIALPFALFAAFPGWLNSLPKSGGWLNTVKVVLGFLELALAFKFLSQADLVLQMHLLEREVFIAIWIAIFGTLALYLFGKIQLPHDSPLKHISVGRLSLGLLVLSFTIYMIPGLWGAPLNLISAFPPPLDYSESPYGVGYTKTGGGSASNEHGDLPEGAHLLAPHDILAFNDYDLGLAYAKKVNKPVMIDFTGWACVNCRKMEQNVWPKPEILNALKNNVVLISLYVDDKRPLEADEIVDSKLREGKKLNYIGQKWSEFQTIKYKSNTQPYYVLMDHDESNLIDPVAYTPDADEYLKWLKSGIGNFNE